MAFVYLANARSPLIQLDGKKLHETVMYQIVQNNHVYYHLVNVAFMILIRINSDYMIYQEYIIHRVIMYS